MPSVIGDNVTIGHGAVLTGVTIEDDAFIGIGAVLQPGTKVVQPLHYLQLCSGKEANTSNTALLCMGHQ